MRTVKAILIHAYGGTGQMQLEEAIVPACGPGDLLVRVVAAGINPVDWTLRSGAMAKSIPKVFRFALGQDGAGVVVAVGGEAQGFKPGDEVFFYAECTRGGTYAEYVAVDAAQVALKPRTVSFATAARRVARWCCMSARPAVELPSHKMLLSKRGNKPCSSFARWTPRCRSSISSAKTWHRLS